MCWSRGGGGSRCFATSWRAIATAGGRSLKDDQYIAYLSGLPILHANLADPPSNRRREFDDILIRFHFGDSLVEFSSIADVNEPLDYFRFMHPFAQVGQLKFVRHALSPITLILPVVVLASG